MQTAEWQLMLSASEGSRAIGPALKLVTALLLQVTTILYYCYTDDHFSKKIIVSRPPDMTAVRSSLKVN